MFRFPRGLKSRRAQVEMKLGLLALFILFFSPAIQAQSVRGFKAPEKPAKSELPIQLRAARGQAPLRKLHDHLKADWSHLKRLPSFIPSERTDQRSNKRVQLGVVRSFAKPLHPSIDSRLYQLAEGEVRVSGIVSEGALYTRVHFTSMSLPAGARVFVYSLKNPDEFYGPYEGRGPSEDGTFWTPPVSGDAVAIEYFSPYGRAETAGAPFIVSEISHVYRDPLKATTDDEAGSCNLEVTSDWTEVAKSVGFLEFVDNGSEYACTGTLLNTQANDQTPYLLTANHCFSSQSAAQSLRVYWNYNTGETPPGGTPFTDGANLLATATSSDFTFVRLTGSLPGGLFFSGWDATTTSLNTPVTGIHHPEGSHKRIAFGATNSTCNVVLPGPCSNFTHVAWNAGTTEGGSSGSGLWKGSPSNPLLVGSLTGGEASCSNRFGIDHYGSFSATYPGIASFLAGSGADLSLIKSTAFDLISPGAQIVYLLTVTNHSASVASAITVTDNLPSEVSYVSCTAAGGTCGGSGNNRTVHFPSLAAGASATAVIVATVNASVSNATVITNSASVVASTSDPNHANNGATALATVQSSPFAAKSNGKIAYGSDHAGTTGPSGFYTINPNGTNDSILFTLEPFGSAPAWSPDGSKIAYGKRNAGMFDAEIHVANADGTGSLKIAGNVFNQNSRIAWSPNGAKVAFIGTGNGIYIVNANGTGLSRLPNTPTSVNDLAWSPDGSKIAYTSGADVFVMGIDGSNQTNLTQLRPKIQLEQALSRFPRWSPDGTKLIFGAESNNYKNVYIMNADGSALAPLVTMHQSMQPAWSPDGARITFVALNGLYVANSDGTGATALPSGGIYNFKPDWQPLAVSSQTVQFSAGNQAVSEGAGHAQILVTRSDPTNAATVDYATTDNAALTECNFVDGLGSSRCDYATTIGTLRFAAGESSKTIFIPVVDDVYTEGTETFSITLSNASGLTLGSPASVLITIQDNDTSSGANPIDATDFFIRQQYIDFLGREPDPAGLAGWRNVMNNCGMTVAPPCDRIEVSAGFFRSEEFQSRGYFIYRFFSALGKIPVSGEFYPDFAKVSGFLTSEQLEANKAAYVNEVMARADFQTKYSATFGNPTAYVDALLQTVGLPTHPGRAGWISTLNSNNNTQTRGQVLRQLVESGEVFNKYFNEAFVIMQYFGYLRRTADASYLNWIQTMNQTNGDYRTMINGFINSAEYRRRFGP